MKSRPSERGSPPRLALVPFATMVLAGCSLAVDLDNLSGGLSADAAVDSGRTPDATLDATLVDAFAVGADDASGQTGSDTATDEADGSSSLTDSASRADSADSSSAEGSVDGSPCAAVHTFCDDFDEDAPLLTGWSGQVLIADGGQLSVTDAYSLSNPDGLFGFAAIPNDSAVGAENFIFRTFVQNPTVIHFAFAMNILDFPTNNTYVAGFFDGANYSAADYRALLLVTSTGWSINEREYPTDGAASQQTNHTLASPPSTVGSWHLLVFDLDVTTAPYHLRVSIDGTIQSDGNLSYSPALSTVGVALGLVSAAPGFQVAFDNVTVDLN